MVLRQAFQRSLEENASLRLKRLVLSSLTNIPEVKQSVFNRSEKV